MCVIIAKPRFCKSPSLKIFENAMMANPDGFAIAYKLPKSDWKVYRTMDALEMSAFIQTGGILRGDSIWIFHARIKTHGPTTIKNCHCWEDKHNDLIFAHNGTFGIKADNGKTDSETFFRHILVPMYQHQGYKAALKACTMIANGHSKIALISKKEKKQIALVGSWINQDEIYYSNESAFREPCYKSLQDVGPYEDDVFDDIGYYKRKYAARGQKLCNTQYKPTTTPSYQQETRYSTANKPHQSAAQRASSAEKKALAL